MSRSSSKRRHLRLIASHSQPRERRRTRAASGRLGAAESRALSSQPAPAPGGDMHVRRAIELLRAALAERWTVTRLARKVGLSRPVFARRFVQSEGVSPARYLARERMRRAAELLGQTQWGLAQVAVRVGYDSEFAFNRAFKRAHGIAPGAFRRAVRPFTPTLLVLRPVEALAAA